MHRQTRATSIPAKVKAAVAERDCTHGPATCILCGAICGVLALFHLPAKYIAFFCAIFILLLACVSAKYLKGSRMQSVPSCTFSQNRAFVCFLSIVYCWFLWFFRPPFLYSWHPFFAFVIYFVSRAILSTILGYISKPLVTYI